MIAQSRAADHWKITPENAALIVVDMQNIWVHPRGARYLPMSEDIVPKLQELLGFCQGAASAGDLSAHNQAS